jgi:osmotically-inducible protein OsmY
LAAAWEDHAIDNKPHRLRCKPKRNLTMTRASNDADLAGQVQSALSSKLGSDAKDLTVTADNGSITLHGWAQGPQEEAKARYVASTVPGVHNAYSAVRTFSTDSND